MWVIPCPAAPPAAGSDPLNTASQDAPAARLPASADASAPATAAGRGEWEARSEKAARAVLGASVLAFAASLVVGALTGSGSVLDGDWLLLPSLWLVAFLAWRRFGRAR